MLGLAYGPDMNSLIFAGVVGIMDPPREGVRDAIYTLMGSGVNVKMLTGDSEQTAKAVGGYSQGALMWGWGGNREMGRGRGVSGGCFGGVCVCV